MEAQKRDNLSSGHVYYPGYPSDILLSTKIPNLPIELSATHLNKKSNDKDYLFDISSLRDLPEALQKPIAIFRYGDPHKTQNIIVEISKDGKNFLIGLHFNLRQNGILINLIRGLFPKDLHEWLNWIQQGKLLYVDKKKIQNQITQRQINLADVSYLDLDSINNIIADFENPSQNSNEIEKSAEKTDGYGLERMETDFYSDETVKFSLVEDKTVLKKLNKAEKDGEVITLYRAAQLIDGKLYPPTAVSGNNGKSFRTSGSVY